MIRRWCLLAGLIIAAGNISMAADTGLRPPVAERINAYYLLSPEDIDWASAFFRNQLNAPFETSGVLTGAYGKQIKTVTYYDTESRLMLAKDAELLHSITENLPVYRSHREQIIYQDHGNLPSQIHTFDVKKYNRKISPIDKHPLFGRVKRKERASLIQLLPEIGDIGSLTAALEVKHNEVAFLVSHFGKTCGAVTLGNISVSNFGVPTRQLIFSIETYPDVPLELNAQEQTELLNAFSAIRSAFEKQAPDVVPLKKLGYSEFHKLASDKLPSHDFFSRYPLLFQLGQILLLIAIGALFLYLAIKRHVAAPSYRFTSRQHRHHE